jgi:hypothetical protein
MVVVFSSSPPIMSMAAEETEQDIATMAIPAMMIP